MSKSEMSFAACLLVLTKVLRMNCEHHRKSFNTIYIIPLLTGLYIYRRKIFLLCPMPCKKKFPREEGFLGGGGGGGGG